MHQENKEYIMELKIGTRKLIHLIKRELLYNNFQPNEWAKMAKKEIEINMDELKKLGEDVDKDFYKIETYGVNF